jgi:regulator of sigma E protease
LLGIKSLELSHQRLSVAQIAVQAIGKTWQSMVDSVQGITKVLFRGADTDNIAGVIGVAQMAGEVAQQGTGPILALIAMLSANLALMNLLPVPVLDGGALLFCAAEMILRRPPSARAHAVATRTGVAILPSLFMFTTLHDLAQTGLFRWIAQL